MISDLAELKAAQSEANSILDYKTHEEKTLAEEIKKTVKDIANRYSVIKKSLTPSEARQKFRENIKSSPDFLNFRTLDASIIRASKNEIARNALKIVCDNLNSQVAAIFLFSKDGVLERTAIYGFDKNGDPIEDDWLGDESYKIGESFTGKAASPKKGEKYGEIQYTPDLSQEKLEADNGQIYYEKLGSLRCAIAIPLNGRNKTYGVLRVINKVEKSNLGQQGNNSISLSNHSFSFEDVRLLLFLAMSITNIFSNFRRDIQTYILRHLSHLLIENYFDGTFKQVTDLLVKNPETAFKAGILRVKDDISKQLIVKAICLFPGVTKNRDNSPRTEEDDGFLWLIADNQENLILQDIQQDLSQFKNKKWIEDNKFQAFACFPLVAKGETLGTLSLYTGYNYEFYPDSIEFLQGVADLIASFLLREKQEREKRNLQNKQYFPHFVELKAKNKEVETYKKQIENLQEIIDNLVGKKL